MKRLHVHIGVADLNESIHFYSALFGEKPDKVKTDYARWMLDDPSVNFAISTEIETRGIEHLGLQVESSEELAEVRSRLTEAQQVLFDEGETTCCYANSDKSWVKDPSGVPWESFLTTSDAEAYFADRSADLSCC